MLNFNNSKVADQRCNLADRPVSSHNPITALIEYISSCFRPKPQYQEPHIEPESKVLLNRLACALEKRPTVDDKGANDTIPEPFHLPKIRSGKDYTIYDLKMSEFYGKNPIMFDQMFKKHVADYNNISGSIIYFPSGAKNVYRSASLAYSPETLKELIQERGVKTIINLSNKNTVDQKVWTQTEIEHFTKLGGNPKNYVHILDFDYLFNDEDELNDGYKKVADIIHQIEHSEGNVLIHCLGGEHKTELVFEVMQRVYNHLSIDNIVERYKRHTAWTPDPKVKSGFKQNNIDFIKDFPVELLAEPVKHSGSSIRL